MRQLAFSFTKNYKKEFGGSLLEGRRKSKRPLSTKYLTHLVLKAEKQSYFKPNLSLNRLIQRKAEKYGIKIHDLALNYDHIHLLLKIDMREDYNNFIRDLTSAIALKIKTFLKQKGEIIRKIFKFRPFTRIISWGRDAFGCREYIALNKLEAKGLIRRIKIKNKGGKVVKEQRLYDPTFLDQLLEHELAQ